MKKFLLWLWEFPQNLAGWVMHFKSSARIENYEFNDGNIGTLYFHPLNKKTEGEAVTLGEYIFLDDQYYSPQKPKKFKSVANHEHGHTIQSRKLGWLYLIVIGLPSIVHAALHEKTCGDEEYEHFYTEKNADELGKV